MNELQESISRLTFWLRDYGHERQPPFVSDVTTVLNAAAALDEREREVKRLREALEHERRLLGITLDGVRGIRERITSALSPEVKHGE